jgi:hypothetical protein
MRSSSRDYVQSLARGLSVLRNVPGDRPSATLAEIAARSGLSRAAARRLVLTLEHLGYVQAAGREYRLTPRVLELGYGFLGARDLTDLAQPWMEQLAHQVNESCSMAVLDGRDIVYVARVSVRKVMTVSLAAGHGSRLLTWMAACRGLPAATRRMLEGLDARHSRAAPSRFLSCPIAETVRRDGRGSSRLRPVSVRLPAARDRAGWRAASISDAVSCGRAPPWTQELLPASSTADADQRHSREPLAPVGG